MHLSFPLQREHWTEQFSQQNWSPLHQLLTLKSREENWIVTQHLALWITKQRRNQFLTLNLYTYTSLHRYCLINNFFWRERKGAKTYVLRTKTNDIESKTPYKCAPLYWKLKGSYGKENPLILGRNKSQRSLTVISGRDLKARARTRDPWRVYFL